MGGAGEDKVGKFALYEVSRPAQCDNVAPKAFSHLPNTRIAKATVLQKIRNDIFTNGLFRSKSNNNASWMEGILLRLQPNCVRAIDLVLTQVFGLFYPLPTVKF